MIVLQDALQRLCEPSADGSRCPDPPTADTADNRVVAARAAYDGADLARAWRCLCAVHKTAGAAWPESNFWRGEILRDAFDRDPAFAARVETRTKLAYFLADRFYARVPGNDWMGLYARVRRAEIAANRGDVAATFTHLDAVAQAADAGGDYAAWQRAELHRLSAEVIQLLVGRVDGDTAWLAVQMVRSATEALGLASDPDHLAEIHGTLARDYTRLGLVEAARAHLPDADPQTRAEADWSDLFAVANTLRAAGQWEQAGVLTGEAVARYVASEGVDGLFVWLDQLIDAARQAPDAGVVIARLELAKLTAEALVQWQPGDPAGLAMLARVDNELAAYADMRPNAPYGDVEALYRQAVQHIDQAERAYGAFVQLPDADLRTYITAHHELAEYLIDHRVSVGTPGTDPVLAEIAGQLFMGDRGIDELSQRGFHAEARLLRLIREYYEAKQDLDYDVWIGESHQVMVATRDALLRGEATPEDAGNAIRFHLWFVLESAWKYLSATRDGWQRTLEVFGTHDVASLLAEARAVEALEYYHRAWQDLRFLEYRYHYLSGVAGLRNGAIFAAREYGNASKERRGQMCTSVAEATGPLDEATAATSAEHLQAARAALAAIGVMAPGHLDMYRGFTFTAEGLWHEAQRALESARDAFVGTGDSNHLAHVRLYLNVVYKHLACDPLTMNARDKCAYARQVATNLASTGMRVFGDPVRFARETSNATAARDHFCAME